MAGTTSIDTAEGCRFYFGIPLRAKASSRNWTLVCNNLERTLMSLARQSRRDFRVVIACHERPEIDTCGLDVEFVIAETPAPAVDAINHKGQPVNDKPLKKCLLGLALARQVRHSFYYMHLDADDLIHPELVATTLDDDNRRGYLIEKGVLFDCANRRFALASAERMPFWRHCGSCAVVYFTPRELPESISDKRCYFVQFQRHREYADLCKQHGRPLTPLEDYMAVYLINHGENHFTTYRNKSDFKSQYVCRYSAADVDFQQQLYALYPQLETV
ncbi:glycosyltransferase family A protein [Kushneria sp. TE3]|uniref:glycosyltransferase family A protein n=1 Tax=Kushneria sp. TE3 TaxID=3449832 RepID=UPI003F688367